jgi:hypothetical protein
MGMVGAGVGVRAGVGVGVGTLAGVGVSISVVAPVEGRGVGVTVVPGVGSAETGTLFSAARNASADWKRLAGSLAIAIRIISFNSAGRSLRSVIGGCGS